MVKGHLFRKNLFMGNLIWISGEDKFCRERLAFTVLQQCEVGASEVLTLTPEQFVFRVRRGFDYATLIRYEVLMVSEFEEISGDFAKIFLECIEKFQSLQMGLGIRLILVSGIWIHASLNEFSKFNPMKIRLELKSRKLEKDFDERVHLLLHQAIQVTQIPIKRLSEKAAVFLENDMSDESDEDLLVLLMVGLNRCDGQVLRLKDFLPHFRGPRGPDSELETLCN